MNNKKLEKQFEKVKEIAVTKHYEGHKLNLMIEEKWGYSYSDKDLDEIIDSIDYGTSNISFERFIELMNDPNKRYIESKKKGGLVE